jgi:hypothetical protein
LSGTARNSGLFNDNLGALCNLGDTASSTLDISIITVTSNFYTESVNQGTRNHRTKKTQGQTNLRKVSSHTSTHTRFLGGSVDRDKDKISLLDGTIDISSEEQILVTTFKDNLIQTRLVDGKLVGIPSVNTGLVQVDNGDLDVVTLVSDDGTSWATLYGQDEDEQDARFSQKVTL